MNAGLPDYPCIGYCQVGEDGYCLGCGRPYDIPKPSGTAEQALTAAEAVMSKLPDGNTDQETV